MRTTHDQVPAQLEAMPDLPELQQRDSAPVVVPVRPDGPVETHELPSRTGAAFTTVLTTSMQHILGADLKRKVTILLADQPWRYSHLRTGQGVRWPADVPLVLTHADEVYAAEHADASSSPNLSVLVEVWAD